MNILLTSVGRRTYLVNYFKEAIGNDGKVHVSNSSPITPAFQEADYSIVTPLIYDQEYIPFLLSYCEKHEIDILISLFDIDLPVLSESKEKFADIGTKVIVSEPKVIKVCNDKFLTNKFLIEHGFNTPRTYNSLEETRVAIQNKELKFPVIIKPRWGMGSIGVYQADNENELEVFYTKTVNNIRNSYLKFESNKKLSESVIVQETLIGQEYGLDIINDLNKNYQNTIVKQKYAMRSGETDCAKVENNPILSDIGKKLSSALGHVGNLDVDVFMTDNQPCILEINARFGGGYPFSHIAGVNLPKAIIDWIRGKGVPKSMLSAEPGILAHKDITVTILKNALTKNKDDMIKIKHVKSINEITEILNIFDDYFTPSINIKVGDIDAYSKKLANNAFVYAAEEQDVVGFVALYANDLENHQAYIPFIAVHSQHRRKNIGSRLIDKCINVAKDNGMKKIKLEVRKENLSAQKFYSKHGFETLRDASPSSYYMAIDIEKK